MVADTNTPIDAAADAAKAQVDAVAETTKAATDAGARTAKTARKSTTKAVRKTTKKTARKSAPKSRRKAKASRAKAQPVRNERKNQMKFDPTTMFAGFGALPGTAAFEKLFTEAAERSEETAKRSRKAAEELAEMYRANMDAVVEASRIAATGAQSISQSMATKTRDSVEQTANTVRSFAEVKNPTELLQLQGDLARTAFDRFVEDSSALTESFVKLAGEAFQPISNRASANVEKLNEIAA
ncbi:MAG TPA: phasin family protein [Sphingomicrobium sp.]|nr:phasin family protein [Sphingomicrobium sp.]